jgi:anti-sigma B factor antagonist
LPGRQKSVGERTGVQTYLSVVVQDQPGVTVLTVSGELDMASSPELDHAIEQLEPAPGQSIVLDLAKLEFMDVTGLRVVLGARERAARLGARLRLVNVRGEVRRLFTVTGATELLDAIESG